MREKYSLLGRKFYRITDKVTVNIPTVSLTRGDNAEDEECFWSEVRLFTVSPDDMASELDGLGIDFTEMSGYSLFVLMFSLQREERLSRPAGDPLFMGFDLWRLELRQTDGAYLFTDENGEVLIDEASYDKISELVCFMTGVEKKPRVNFGNELARKKWIEHDRKKKARARKEHGTEPRGGVLDGIILRLVCNANFPYNFETVGGVTLFDLIWSLKQIEKDSRVDELMRSRLVGVDLRKFSDEQLSRYVL